MSLLTYIYNHFNQLFIYMLDNHTKKHKNYHINTHNLSMKGKGEIFDSITDVITYLPKKAY